MIPVIPWSITMVVVVATVALAVAIWSVLSAAARRSGLEPAAQRRVRLTTAAFFGAWLGAILLSAPAPSTLVERDPFAITPAIPMFLGASILVVIVAIWRSAVFRRVLAATPIALLHALQAWRVLGIVFVILYARGELPAHFALPAGWGDVVVGLTAPLVALVLARRAAGARPLAVAWNVFGLLDLVVAVGMGTGLLAPILAPELGSRVPPAAAMGVLPLLLVPAFAVPLAVLLHLLALAGLLRSVRFGAELVPRPAE